MRLLQTVKISKRDRVVKFVFRETAWEERNSSLGGSLPDDSLPSETQPGQFIYGKTFGQLKSSVKIFNLSFALWALRMESLQKPIL